MSARLVNLTLLGLILLQAGTGLAGFFTNQSPLPFDVHRYGAAAVLIILVFKARNVYQPLVTKLHRVGMRPGAALSILLSLLLAILLILGLLWFFGLLPLYIDRLATPLDLHIWVSLGLLPLLLIHVFRRWNNPRMQTPLGRRQAIKLLLLGVGGFVLWRLTLLADSLTIQSEATRFTGSRESGSFSTCFPATTWLFDSYPQVDIEAWTLTVMGMVDQELVLTYEDLVRADASIVAVLDCTSGWFAQLEWRGMEVQQILREAGIKPEAHELTFYSITGHSASLPLAEARMGLLATQVGGETLPIEYGYPLRLVAPSRRGFQWIKWLSRIEVS